MAMKRHLAQKYENLRLLSLNEHKERFKINEFPLFLLFHMERPNKLS